MVMTATRPGSSGAVRPTLVDGDIHTTTLFFECTLGFYRLPIES